MSVFDLVVPDSRTFETGIDRGVFYSSSGVGVVWNGLMSVEDTSPSDSLVEYYLDGFKYLNISASSKFEATLSSFSRPKGFEACDGTYSIRKGLYVTHLKRKSFGLSYRTIVGNNFDGIDYAYQVHLVYNVLAIIQDLERKTVGETVSATTFSWNLETVPLIHAAFKPASHFVIDSRFTPPSLLQTIENILYGTESTPPRLPTLAELLDIFGAYVPPSPEYDIFTLLFEGSF